MRNAARRHLQDLVEGPKRGLRWDLPAALRAIEFFPDVLKLSQGKFEGVPFRLESSQQFIVGSLFGWKRPDGFRRFRRAYVEMAKGSGKTPMAAGIGMYCLMADKEPRAEVYAAASMKSQAMYIFRAAVAMYQQSPALAERLTPSGGNPIWNLADLKTGSFFRPISTEEGHSGPLPSCALCDEVHEHRDGRMIEMLERGFKSRRQPLLLMITNSGSNRQSVCWQEHIAAVRAAAGQGAAERDPAFVYDPQYVAKADDHFAFVCSLDEGDDILADEACWVKANPLIGITMPVDEMRRAVNQAKVIPGKLNSILRLHGCVWTDAETAWMSRATLESTLADFNPADHTGEKVFIGVDLSATQDLTAAAFVVPTGEVEVERTDKDGRVTRVRQPTFDAWVEAWTPKDTLEQRALRDEAPYDIWARDGWLTPTPGKFISFDYMAVRIAEVAALYDAQCIAYDSYAFNKHFVPALDAAGVTIPLVEHPQGGKKKGAESGLWMPGSKLALEQAILEGRVRLRRSPVLISACMSAAIEGDAFGNFWFSKRRATNRIDALVALAMAFGAANAGNAPEGQSYLDQGEEILVI